MKPSASAGVTYCQNVIFSRRGELLGRHQPRLGLNEKLPVFVSLLDAVGDLSVGPVVTVGCNHPVHRVSFEGSLFLRPLALRELDLVDLLQEQRPVVILIEHLDDDAYGGGLGRNAVVGNGDLRGWKHNTEIQYTNKLILISVGVTFVMSSQE